MDEMRCARGERERGDLAHALCQALHACRRVDPIER
jgi:hypothetical protein